jgi:hypothetical protein
MVRIHKEIVAAMRNTVLLFLVPFCHKGHHSSLAMYGVKMTEQAHVWVLAVCKMVK